uniref:Uncharacterized protein n=1 Tax=Plectus sambesii TaxID=2011161 RepID=A0A914X8M7_9BILA
MSFKMEEPPPDRKNTKINFHVFEHAQIQGIPEAVVAKRASKRYTWIAVVIFVHVACFVHLYWLLNTFFVQPNETTVSFQQEDELNPPRVLVCQPATRMLNPKSVSSISAEYYYALELGVGLIHITELSRLEYLVNVTQVEEHHQQILRENNGSASAAYRKFHEKHMRKCEDVFSHCYTELYKNVSCCDIFEPVFTLYGMCYVSKKDAVVIKGSDSLANFRFRLKFAGSSLPDFFVEKPVKPNPLAEPNFEAYEVGFADGLDQGNFLVEREIVLPSQWLTVNMVQKLRWLMSNPKVCVDSDDGLKFFREYTRSNCRWEQVLFKNIKSNNKSCELPLVELLKPGYKSASPCNMTQIFDLFGYDKGDAVILDEAAVDQMNDASPAEIRPYIAENCNLYRNRSDLPKCSVNFLQTLGLPEETNPYLHLFANVQPFTLEQRYGQFLDLMPDAVDSCLPLCYTIVHGLRMSVVNNRRNLGQDEASVVLQYTSKEVEKVIESPRQTVSEYFALIGGNIGLWSGASIVSFGHLLALALRAVGVRLF